jgi:hypothetical protein
VFAFGRDEDVDVDTLADVSRAGVNNPALVHLRQLEVLDKIRSTDKGAE